MFLPVLFLVFLLNPFIQYLQKLIDILFKQYSVDKKKFLETITDIILKDTADKIKIDLLAHTISKYLMIKVESIYCLTFNGLLYEKIYTSKRKHPHFVNKGDVQIFAGEFRDIILLPDNSKYPVFLFIIQPLSKNIHINNCFKLIEKIFLEYYNNKSLKEKVVEQISVKKFHNISKNILPMIDNTIKKIIQAVKIFSTGKNLKNIQLIDFQPLIRDFTKFMEKLK